MIYAAPAFLLPYLLDGSYSFHELSTSSWLTANLVLGSLASIHRSRARVGQRDLRFAWTWLRGGDASVAGYRAASDDLDLTIGHSLTGSPHANRLWLQQQTWEALVTRGSSPISGGLIPISTIVRRAWTSCASVTA